MAGWYDAANAPAISLETVFPLHLPCTCNEAYPWSVQGKTLDLVQLDQNDAAFR